jgi:hypothetical protein
MGLQITTREFDRVVVVDPVGKLTLSDSRTQLRDLIHVLSNTEIYSEEQVALRTF